MSIFSKQSVPRLAAAPCESRPLKRVYAVADGDTTHSELVAAQVNEMPADTSTKRTVALTDAAFSPDAKTLSGQTVEQQQQILQMLCAHPLLHSGDLVAAAQIITSAIAAMLDLDRVSLWQFENTALRLVNRYDSRQNQHIQDEAIAEEVCASYLAGTGLGEDDTSESRTELAVENVVLAIASPASPLGSLAKKTLIYSAPGAFLEIVVRCRGKAVGVLWCERIQAHRWSALEKAMLLSAALLTATAIDAVAQTALSSRLDKQNLQLKRETIERQQAEQAWQESQRFIQGIIDASTNILYVDGFVDGQNIYISRWIVNVLGYEADEIQKLGTQYLEKLIHADEKALMISERKRLSATNDGEVVENEYRFRHRQGGWRWLLCRETVFQRNKNGQPTQIFGTATDITKRKHAEMALLEFNRELERLASMDGLTQVANRRSFDIYLTQEWQNIGAGRSSLALILCDIDYFKSFNDTYGHQAGDVCLRRVAQSIERAVKRSTDLVARYGGEEFAVILPNTDADGVEQVAQGIQREIQQLGIPHSQSSVSKRITLSLGLSVVTSTANSHPDKLVAAADQGLYRAKYEGRDRYCTGMLDIPRAVS